ncbi:ROK family transcriptional regulator [Pseudogulbenkiania ferrooxidans]|uniref:ROK family transcriptional regulator n=1 Tax=Pseudogulbenkiania ferrooxidans TaxID=549169 RepID=UPI0004CFDF16|nr:ROK family transcriptional regulator [Pseudogulbenkiania ferrooxidans]
MKKTSSAAEPRTVSGTNLEYARSHNRRAVLETVRLNGQLTRADLARLTALTPQTVSNIAAELLDAGMLLAGQPLREGARGQPAIPLTLNPDGAYAVGMQLDHQMLVALALDLSGRVRVRLEAPVSRPSPDEALPLISDLLQRLRRESSLDWGRLLGLGLVMPGPFGVEGMTSVGPTTLPGWEGVDAAGLERALGLPVLLEKDATAAAIGERLYGMASELRNFVYLFIGAGLGAGLFLDGRLYTGGRRNAGEAGHMMVVPAGRPCDCGNRGCLERYVSLQALYEELGIAGGPLATPEHLAARGIDAAGERWLDAAAGPLRQAINILESMLDIDAVVLGGLLPPVWQEALMARLHPLPLSVRSSSGERVRQGSAGRDVVALGAAALLVFDEFNPQYEVLLKGGRR